jgi:aspartyl-tRNA(Asn)/glutamyl-tRNA(Gln) amidotransferase subunit C
MLTEQQVLQIATLTKLEVSDNTSQLAKDLSGILDIVDTLQAVDTTDTKPMAHPFDGTQRLRIDEVRERNNRELYQQNAPLVERGHYLVPKVL